MRDLRWKDVAIKSVETIDLTRKQMLILTLEGADKKVIAILTKQFEKDLKEACSAANVEPPVFLLVNEKIKVSSVDMEEYKKDDVEGN